MITYSLLRLALFAAALLVLWLVGMGGWLLVLVAVVVAFALSYVLLGRQRDAAARWLADRQSGARPGLQRLVTEDADVEDAADEAARRASGEGGQQTGDGGHETGDGGHEAGDGGQETGDGGRQAGERPASEPGRG